MRDKRTPKDVCGEARLDCEWSSGSYLIATRGVGIMQISTGNSMICSVIWQKYHE